MAKPVQGPGLSNVQALKLNSAPGSVTFRLVVELVLPREGLERAFGGVPGHLGLDLRTLGGCNLGSCDCLSKLIQVEAVSKGRLR